MNTQNALHTQNTHTTQLDKERKPTKEQNYETISIFCTVTHDLLLNKNEPWPRANKTKNKKR